MTPLRTFPHSPLSLQTPTTTTMASSSFSFPTLNRKEIATCLYDLGIAGINDQDLLTPTPEFVTLLYTNILILLDPNQDDTGQADFHALGRLENPDLHVESVRTMNLLRKIKDLVAAVRCPTSFTLKDLVKPDKMRTGFFLSAILNFCLQRESKLQLIQPYFEQIDVQEQKKAKLEERIMKLNDEILEMNAASKNEQPFVQEVEAKVRELTQNIHGLNNHQLSLRGSFRNLRDKIKDIDEQIGQADFKLAQSAQENAELRSKIVQSPEKLQGAVEEKKSIRDEFKISERSAMQSFQEKSTTLEVYSKACKKMAKHLTQMQAIQDQASSAKTIDKEVKVLKSKLSEESVLEKSLEAKLVERQGQVEQMKESLEASKKERDLKHEEATKDLKSFELEMESKKHNLESRERRIEAMYAEVDNITSKQNSVKGSELFKQQELHRCCQEVVHEFHNYSHNIGTLMQRTEAGLQGEDQCA